jgi:hypothetical protein
MPTIRDLVGPCGHVSRDTFLLGGPLETTSVSMECPQCGRAGTFRDTCTGGLKNRWRCNDFPDDPAFYRGQIRVRDMSATVGSEDGPDATNVHTGEPMAASEHFSDDKRGERADMKYHETDRRRGTLPIVCDMKRAKK